MGQPDEFSVNDKEKLVYKSKKILYGLKQAPRKWCKKFDSFMENYSFNKTMYYHCVFMKKFGDNDFIILLLYVNDMLIIGQDASKIDNLKRELSNSFAMKDLGLAKQILERINMSKAKSVYSLLADHFKLRSKHCPTSDKEK